MLNSLITKKILLDVISMIGQKNEKFPVIVNDYQFVAGVTEEGVIELIVSKILIPDTNKPTPQSNLSQDNLSREQAKLQLINEAHSQQSNNEQELHVFHIKGNDVTIIQ